jgi:hypothetical protein
MDAKKREWERRTRQGTVGESRGKAELRGLKAKVSGRAQLGGAGLLCFNKRSGEYT